MMVQELQSTEILQTDFVSNVSHEFKTPISAIEGYTTLLQGTDNIDEIESGYIEKILFNTRRLSSLVSNTEMVEVLTGKEITVEFSEPRSLQIDGETVLDVKSYTAKAPVRVAAMAG